MNCLSLIAMLFLVALKFSIAHDTSKRSIFSWSRETKQPEFVPGYLPALKVHKYQGVQINPVDGPSIYSFLPNDTPLTEGLELTRIQAADQLPPESAQQLEVLQKVVDYLPEENGLQDYDYTPLLPYVNMISDDSLARVQYAVESTNSKQQSKLLKVIHFIKALKEKKLKPFKIAANFGASLYNKKKETASNFLHFGNPTDTSKLSPIIVPETSTVSVLPGGFPINYSPAFPPHFYSDGPFISSVPYHSFPSRISQLEIQQEQQQQPTVETNDGAAQNFANLYSPHNTLQGLPPQITPGNAYFDHSFQSAPQQNEIIKLDSQSTLIYPQLFPQFQHIKQLDLHPSIIESTSVPQHPNPHIDETYLTRTSNKPSEHQFAEQQTNSQSQYYDGQEQNRPTNEYLLTPDKAFATNDLTALASDNVEKIKQNPGFIPKVNDKEEHKPTNVENDASSSTSRPITKLRPLTIKPPVYVFPETFVESKPHGLELPKQVQSEVPSSSTYKSTN